MQEVMEQYIFTFFYIGALTLFQNHGTHMRNL